MNRNPYGLVSATEERQCMSSSFSSLESSSLSRNSPIPALANEAINPMLQKTVGSYTAACTARSLTPTKSKRHLQMKKAQQSTSLQHPSIKASLNRISTPTIVEIPSSSMIQHGSFTNLQDTRKQIQQRVSRYLTSLSRNRSQQKRLLKWSFWVLAPMCLLVIASIVTRKPVWKRLDLRELRGRHCIMNSFVDKQPPNEFNPDYPARRKMQDTYRSKGQFDTIARFISSVADSFRSNLNIEQHVVFTGTRDGGHLAQEALLFWPARGRAHHTQLHIFAAHPDDPQEDEGSDGLEYSALETIEKRFDGSSDRVHLYDHAGNSAGRPFSQEDDDGTDGYEQLLHSHFARRRLQQHEQMGPLSKTIFKFDGSLKNVVIPYMHVDGINMKKQLEILESSRSLLADHTIVVVGIEHSPDLDVNVLVEFFDNLKYKTFLLGLRQLTRIDNLCPEVLNNVLNHPSLSLLSNHDGVFGRQMSLSSLTSTDRPRTPPFFVAMPKGRHSKEEMTIQHMYDLFSGSGGGGQVKTANDRKAPGRK